jgi:hypothetical protein
MNPHGFDPFIPLKKSITVDTIEKAARNGGYKGGELSPALKVCRAIVNDDERFLRIVERTSRIECYREPYVLLQSKDIQRFTPRQVLIPAWRDFGAPSLQRR